VPTPNAPPPLPPAAPVAAMPGALPQTAQGSLSPMFPGVQAVSGDLGQDTLQLGNKRYGLAAGFGEIREVRTLVPITELNLLSIVAQAAALTKNNGIDEIYFVGEDKKLYVMFAEKSRLGEVREGYLGRANVGGANQRVQVLAVEDEANNFSQGMMSTWKWLHGVLMRSFGTEASNTVSGLVTTSIGSFVAAAALKTSAPVTAPAAGTAAGSFIKNLGAAMSNAVNTFVQTMASVVLFAVGAVGLISIFTGIRGQATKGNMQTIDMVTGRY
jgi:hypothetical protein